MTEVAAGEEEMDLDPPMSPKPRDETPESKTELPPRALPSISLRIGARSMPATTLAGAFGAPPPAPPVLGQRLP